MDSFFEKQKLNRIDFIKCDVEGAELFVFKGGIKTIEKYRPIILSEMYLSWTLKFNYQPNDIIKFFENLNYKCVPLKDLGSKNFITNMLENSEETNFLFIPIEKIDFVENRINNRC
jgi:hypothetical protein